MLAKIQEYFFPIPHTDIDEEAMELYRMSSGFKTKEIIRLRAEFLKISGGREAMTKDMFCAMPQIINNPLLDRICVCFGYEASNNTITFEDFLNGVASFNSPGLKEQKLKDFDGDGSLSKMDLYRYFERITNKLLTPDEINKIIDEVFKEVHLTKDNDKISFTQFQTIVVPLDFQARLQLPI